MLAALQAVPYLLFGLFAGAIADRADRRRLMVGCNVLQTIVLATVPLAAAAGVLGVEQVFVVAIVSATLFVWFDAANFGAMPLIAGRDRLVEANAAVSGASSLIAVVGPAVAGVLAATIGPAYAIGIDAASYGLSAIALLLVRHRSRPVTSIRRASSRSSAACSPTCAKGSGSSGDTGSSAR